MTIKPGALLLLLLLASALLLALGTAAGSTGLSFAWSGEEQAMARQILWEIRLPRSLGAWCAGALLGLSGAIAQGLFRNPLADPFLLGSAAGASLGVALMMAALGSATGLGLLGHLGLSGAAFVGTLVGVGLALLLARGAEQTLRLLLAGIVVGVVLNAITNLVMLMAPDTLRSMQAFLLGTTGFLGWSSAGLLAGVLAVCVVSALAGAPALDALTLGESTAVSLGIRLGPVRSLLLGTFALATGTAVAQAGMIAFVGLVAPHLVRNLCSARHGRSLLLAALAGGVLLLSADILARTLLAPQELPVGIVTAILGGGYLLWLMHRRGVGRRA